MEGGPEVAAALDRARQLLSASTWPPDIFAALVDVLGVDGIWQSVQDKFIAASNDPLRLSDGEERLRYDVRITSPQWSISPTFRTHGLAAIRDAGKWHSANSRSPPDASGFPLQLTWLARAIDAEAAELSLRNSSLIAAKFQEARDQLAKTGSLTRAAVGRVIPTAAIASSGNASQRFFSNLLRIPASEDRWVDYRVRSTTVTATPGDQLKFGFIPTVLNKEEVVWGIHRNRFTVELSAAHEEIVVKRALRALKWLLERGAHVIVIPELVSSERLRDSVSKWLREHAPAQPLLVVCGSEAVPSASATKRTNRAFVLGPLGQDLWTQDKHHQYTMSASNIVNAGLDAILGNKPRQEIGTSFEKRVVICDLYGVARICVLICEDFAQQVPGPEAMRTYGVDLGIVLVMDADFPESGWRKRHAINAANEPGARIAVGNSRAVLARLEAGKRRARPSTNELAYLCTPNQVLTTIETLPKRGLTKTIALLIAPKSKL